MSLAVRGQDRPEIGALWRSSLLKQEEAITPGSSGSFTPYLRA